LHKKCRNSNEEILSITKKIQNSYSVLCKYERSKVINIEVIEAIASVRFCLQVAADFLNSCGNAKILSETEYQFIDQIKLLCTNEAINKNFDSDSIVTGPGIYLVRLLVRIYGYSDLLTVSKKFNWIIPETFSSTSEVSLRILNFYIVLLNGFIIII